jgi:SAM-dependent methyltransferase
MAHHNPRRILKGLMFGMTVVSSLSYFLSLSCNYPTTKYRHKYTSSSSSLSVLLLEPIQRSVRDRRDTIISNSCNIVGRRLWSHAEVSCCWEDPNVPASSDTLNPSNYDDSIDDSATSEEADSQFGTKQYWDDMYVGMGDFDAEEYCWYYGFDAIQPYFFQFMPLPPKHLSSSSSKSSSLSSSMKMLVPGVGNDGTLLDLYKFGFHDIVAFDYSAPAIDRQRELLSFHKNAGKDITLVVRDARKLDDEWTDLFDIIFEKGALDAIFLSGSGNVQLAVQELKRVLQPGGYFMSISGVVPEDVRRTLFPVQDWEWIRDGTTDLKAGCFVWRKKQER